MLKEIKYAKIELYTAQNKQLADIFKKLSKSIKVYQKAKSLEPQTSNLFSHNQYSLKIDQNLEELKNLKHTKKDIIKIKKRLREQSFNNTLKTSIPSEIEKSQLRLTNKLRFNLNNKSQYQPSQNTNKDSITNIQDVLDSTLPKNIKSQIRNTEELSASNSNTNSNSKLFSKLKIKNFFVKKQNIKAVMASKIKLKQMTRQFKRHPHQLTLDQFHTYYQLKKKYLDDLISQPSQKIFQRQPSTDRVYSKHVQNVDQLQRMGTDIQYILSQCSNVLECHYTDLHKFQEVQKIKKVRRNTSNFRCTFDPFDNSFRKASQPDKPRLKLKKIVSRKPISILTQKRQSII